MSQLNHIDKLFSEKLSNRQARNYNPQAWEKASAMLDQYFKMLFWKKMLLGFVVLMMVSAGASYLLLQENEAIVINDASKQKVEAEYDNIHPVNASLSNADRSNSEIFQNRKAELSSDEKQETLKEDVADRINEDQSTSGNTNNKASRLDKNKIVASLETSGSAKNSAIEEAQGSTNLTHKASTKAPLKSISVSGLNQRSSLRLMPPFSIMGVDLNSTDYSPEQRLLSNEGLMQEIRKVDISLVGGMAIVSGFNNLNDAAQKTGLGWLAGFEATYHFHQKLYARTGAVLTGRNALASRRVVHEGFSENIYSDPEHLMYIDIPIQVGYNIGARHSVYFGMNFSPLLGYKNVLEHTTVESDQRDEKVTRTDVQGIKREGYASFDVAGSIGYKIQLTQRISAFSELRYGLFDLTDNNYFGTDVVDDRNHQIRLALSYRLLSR